MLFCSAISASKVFFYLDVILLYWFIRLLCCCLSVRLAIFVSSPLTFINMFDLEEDI